MEDTVDLSASLEELLAASEEHDKDTSGSNATLLRLSDQHLMRRLASEHHLESLVEWEFQPGASYHLLSNGDIDFFSYLKFIIRQQPLKYLIISSWVVSKYDMFDLEYYLKLGRIKKVDFYVGEIFSKEFAGEYSQLVELIGAFGGRVVAFRNHCKALVGFGERYDFVAESSGNMNANVRSENTCITLNTELARFYKDFFDNIKSDNEEFEDWQPVEI